MDTRQDTGQSSIGSKYRKGRLALKDLKKYCTNSKGVFFNKQIEKIFSEIEAWTRIQRSQHLNKDKSTSKKTILLLGESGVGKSFFAMALHNEMAEKDFYPLNCAAIPKELFESELFGHKKGSFTSAASDKKGLVELANEGTLFLDEIGELDFECQTKILKFIEERTYLPVGGLEIQESKVEIICATNQDLSNKKHFRRDLFYRLTSGLVLEIPPLRKRKEELHLLIDLYFDGVCRKYQKQLSPAPFKITGIRRDALALLLDYSWQGNLRQLRSVIEKAVFKTYSLNGTEKIPPEIIRECLSQFDGNKEETERKDFIFPDDPKALKMENLQRALCHHVYKLTGKKKEAMEILGIKDVKTLNKYLEMDDDQEL